MRIWSIIAALALSAITVPVTAQQGGAQAKPAIAVVDIGHILENHPTLKGQMEQIEAEMKAADERVNAQRKAIMDKMEQLRANFTAGTPEYEAQEKKIAQEDTDLRLAIMKEKKRFDEKQAMVVYKVHSDISNLCQAACNAWGCQVVMRVSREKMDPKKPETVQIVMSQSVIYFDEKIDITDWVVGQLKATASRAGGAVNR